MFQIEDVLIPARFICYILQVLLTISCAFEYEDFIDSTIEGNSQNENKVMIRYWVILSLFFLFEIFEFIILLSGYTLFIELLSVVQIFFHSIAVLILNWFYRDAWNSELIWVPFLLGGIIPGLLEIYNLIILCSSNRVITKIK